MMKKILKISTPIQASAVLLIVLLYAVLTAGYLNATAAATAAAPAAAPAALSAPLVPESLNRLPAEAIAIPVLPANIALVPEHVASSPVSGDLPEQGICLDADGEDDVNRLLLAAEKAQHPPSDDAPAPEPQQPEPPFHHLILQAANDHDIEPALIRAVILAESNYNPRAVSKRGARGLMQLMPRTAAALGVEDLFDPADNINGGVKYLRQLLDRFDNDMRLALAAYNAGSRHVRNYNGVPPFRATRLYIKKVFKYKDIFQQEMGASRQTV
jgi:soluble lytic murein transglycosylase-like protein